MKRIDWRAINSHRNYTIKEAWKSLGVAERTIGRWISAGLPTVDNARPLLIRGIDLVSFLRRRSKKRKRRCPPGHLYCVGCNHPRIPFGSFVDWLPSSSGAGLLRGICGTCGALIHRGASVSDLKKFKAITFGLDVTFPTAQMRLSAPNYPLVNVALEGDTHAKILP